MPEGRLLQIDNMVNLPHLVQSMVKGGIWIVTDGSYRNNLGTASIIMESKDQQSHLMFLAITPGDPIDMSAYHSELTGILTAILMCNKIEEFIKIQAGALELGCDGLSALQQAQLKTLFLFT